MTMKRTSQALLTAALAVGLSLPLASIGNARDLKHATGSHEPAIEILRQINRNPAVAHSSAARREALLTTGSVVKSGGLNRVLYHLPASGRGLRLAGETDTLEWPVHISREQLGGAIMLRLAYQNAVSVMPEASHLAVEINGVMIGKKAIQSPDRARVLAFNVPSHLIVPGTNAVRISARQRHRVDCSIDSTHELWTDIDAAQSGFVFSTGNSVLNTLASLPSIARNKAGQVKLRLLANGTNQPQQIERLMMLSQHTAIHAGFSAQIVEVAGKPGRGPGLDIFTGTLHQLRRIAPDYASKVANSASVQIIARDGSERVAMILLTGEVTSDTNETEFRTKLNNLFASKAPRGSDQGIVLANRERNTQIEEGRKITFAELGLQGEEFDGRLFRRAFKINLPSDYFAADYNQSEMHLATGYSGGLLRNNKLIVRVNGVTATGFGLSNPAGHVFRDKMLRIPLSAFRPGSNTIELEAQLASKADQTCDPQYQVAGPKRFVISGKSWIRFPRLAHLARLPDLAGTLATGFPYVIAGKSQKTVLAVPSAGLQELSTAAGMVTQIATAAGQPIDVDLQYGLPDKRVKSAIIVSTYSELPPGLAREIKGIDREAFDSAWLNPVDTRRQRTLAMIRGQEDAFGIDPMTTAATPATSSQPALPTGLEVNSDVLEGWEKASETERPDDEHRISFSSHVATLFSAVFSLRSDDQEEGPVINEARSDILVTQRISPASERAVWTIVTARDEESLRAGAGLISRPIIANRIGGETAVIDGIAREVTSSTVSQNYVAVREFSLRNMHLIVAGWFSNNHHIYSLLLLMVLIGFGLVSTRVLRFVGANADDKRGQA